MALFSTCGRQVTCADRHRAAVVITKGLALACNEHGAMSRQGSQLLAQIGSMLPSTGSTPEQAIECTAATRRRRLQSRRAHASDRLLHSLKTSTVCLFAGLRIEFRTKHLSKLLIFDPPNPIATSLDPQQLRNYTEREGTSLTEKPELDKRPPPRRGRPEVVMTFIIHFLCSAAG